MHLVVLINARYWCAAKRTVTMDRLGRSETHEYEYTATGVPKTLKDDE